MAKRVPVHFFYVRFTLQILANVTRSFDVSLSRPYVYEVNHLDAVFLHDYCT